MGFNSDPYMFPSFDWLFFFYVVVLEIVETLEYHLAYLKKKKKKILDPAQVRALLELCPMTQAGNDGGIS